MLKPLHDYAWGYTLFLGELTNGTFAIGSRRHKLRPEGAGNKKIGGPLVGLSLDVCVLAVPLRSVDKNALLAVQQNVTGLVE